MQAVRIAIEGLLWALGVFLMWRVLFRDRLRTRGGDRDPRSRISVIVPARNEEHQIGRLLLSLGQQTVVPHEVIVVDDDSTDSTGAIARQKGALVILGEQLPGGWNGKAWACWQGARASAGDLLLFLDADTWLEPEGIERLVEWYEGSGLLTLQPFHVTHRPYEQLSAFLNIVVMAAMGAFTPFGYRLKPGGGFGPCVMCRRDEYSRTGGHREVVGEVIEDIPLAKLFLRQNLPVRCYAGRGIVCFRMYPGGIRDLIEGWSKGMGYGAMSVSPVLSILTAAWITGCFRAFAGLIRATTPTAAPAAWQGVIVYCCYVVVIWWVLRGVGRFKWYTSALFPVPLCFFGLIVARSLLLTYVARRVMWKGREVNTSRRGGKLRK